jgi:hypothetical protein
VYDVLDAIKRLMVVSVDVYEWNHGTVVDQVTASINGWTFGNPTLNDILFVYSHDGD